MISHTDALFFSKNPYISASKPSGRVLGMKKKVKKLVIDRDLYYYSKNSLRWNYHCCE